MRKSLITTALLTSVIALSACSKMHNNAETISGENAETNNIVGGTSVAASEDIAKTTVQIFTVQTKRDATGALRITGVAGCTGSLLANDIVLTAAHCTTDNPNYILLYFSTQAPDMKQLMASVNTNPLIRRVVGGKVGTNWPRLTETQQSDWGDIALLKFKGGIPQGYQPAQLLPSDAELKAQQAVTLAGFGLTDGVRNIQSDRLLKVDITILNPSYSRSEMVVDSGNGKGPCHGDSGGPAYVNVNGQRFLAGITSRAESQTDPKGQCIGDTIYTRTQPYSAWIKSSMQTLQSPNFKPALIPQPQG